MSFGLIFYVLQSKSSEAEMDALKDEYHQRVATLERKVRHHFSTTACFYGQLVIAHGYHIWSNKDLRVVDIHTLRLD
jgi:hypothetical protein